MTSSFNSVKKLSILLLFCLFVLPVPPANAENGFVVKPVQEADQVRLLSFQTWPLGNDNTELMFKLAYLRGLLDAWQLSALAPKATNAVLYDLQGMSLPELLAAVDAHYQQSDEKNAPLPPASVILRIISTSYKEGQP